MVEVSDLHMHFGPVRALSGVSFVARDGAITGLLGENGAGKTTTLNIVSGLHEPTRGSVVVDGHAVGDPFERRRHVGALLDDKGLYARLTARENVQTAAEIRRTWSRDRSFSVHDEVERLLDLVSDVVRRPVPVDLGRPVAEDQLQDYAQRLLSTRLFGGLGAQELLRRRGQELHLVIVGGDAYGLSTDYAESLPPKKKK